MCLRGKQKERQGGGGVGASSPLIKIKKMVTMFFLGRVAKMIEGATIFLFLTSFFMTTAL